MTISSRAAKPKNVNKENAKQYIPLLEALADGELQIQQQLGEWLDAPMDSSIGMHFHLPPERYRRKPKPKPREFDLYINPLGYPGCAYSDTEPKPIMPKGTFIRVREVIK